MSRGMALLVVAALLLGVSNLWAQQSGSKDSAPASAASWHVSKVLTLDRARAGDAAQPNGGPLKYLHVQINFSPTAADRKLHNFRVTDERGNAVGDLWGYNDNESLLIFEGEQPWSSLTGLYLDGQGHREPLFAPPPVAVKPAVRCQAAVGGCGCRAACGEAGDRRAEAGGGSRGNAGSPGRAGPDVHSHAHVCALSHDRPGPAGPRRRDAFRHGGSRRGSPGSENGRRGPGTSSRGG